MTVKHSHLTIETMETRNLLPGLQVRASNLFGFDQVVQGLGGDYRGLFEQAELDPGLLTRPNDLLPYTHFNTLLNLGASELACPYFGILCGKIHQNAPFDTFLQLMKRSPNLASATDISNRYRNIESEVTFWQVEIEGGLAMVYRYNEVPFQFDIRQHRMFTVTRAFLLGELLLQNKWRPKRVGFGFAKPGPGDYQKLFGVPVFFDQESDSYCFPAEDLYEPLPSSDEDLLAILQNHADELKQKFQFGESMVSVVRKLIMQSLSSGNGKLESIAKLLQMHPRSLQRRLLAEGISFKELLAQTRFTVASDLLLKSDLALTHIADILGYSELSAFSRSFKRQTGLAPELWRAQALTQPMA